MYVEGGSLGYIDSDPHWDAYPQSSEMAHKTVSGTSPTITHLGSMIGITTSTSHHSEAVLIPLRNGFPLQASDRNSPIFSLMNENGCRAGHAIKVKDFGLVVHFDGLAPSGHYFVRNSSPVGRA